jgi:ABC-2 type transport system permease protein
MPIFDQGYQHWNGPLSGHAWRWVAIARHGVRVGMQRRVFRAVLLVSLLPAVALAVALAMWGLVERRLAIAEPIVDFLRSNRILDPLVLMHPQEYRTIVWTLCYNLFLSSELVLSMLLVLLVGPDLISQDLRFHALPLYLSRPLRRIDYLVGKLGVIAAFLGLVVIVPCALAYVLGLLFSLDMTIVQDTWRLLLATIAYGLVIIVSAGTLVLALSSLSRNSRHVALFWLVLWVVSGLFSTVLQYSDQLQRRQERWRHQAADQAAEQPIRQFARRAGGRMPGRVLRGPALPARPTGPVGGGPFADEIEASKTNWRPLVSYTANLSRIGNQLLGTDDCRRKLAELIDRPWERNRYLAQSLGPQYPWYWSAAVLAGLFGISACILSLSIRSLDRLR